jgi:hypothetical protein
VFSATPQLRAEILESLALGYAGPVFCYHRRLSEEVCVSVGIPNQFVLSVLFTAALTTVGVRASGQTTSPPAIVTQVCTNAIVGTPYNCQLEARGGITPYRWQITDGKLPAGLRLAGDFGVINGVTNEVGEFEFTVAAVDSASPANQVQRKLILRVVAAMVVKWIEPPHVQDQSISGKIEVTNQTAKPFDLTVIILAVNEIGKAFALGYQHFTLPPGKVSPPIPFGTSLPFGKYVVNVDSIAEVPEINLIYRVHLESNGRLEIKQP